jgi:hypothetical protein
VRRHAAPSLVEVAQRKKLVALAVAQCRPQHHALTVRSYCHLVAVCKTPKEREAHGSIDVASADLATPVRLEDCGGLVSTKELLNRPQRIAAGLVAAHTQLISAAVSVGISTYRYTVGDETTRSFWRSDDTARFNSTCAYVSMLPWCSITI